MNIKPGQLWKHKVVDSMYSVDQVDHNKLEVIFRDPKNDRDIFKKSLSEVKNWWEMVKDFPAKPRQNTITTKTNILNSYTTGFSALYPLSIQKEKIAKVLTKQYFYNQMPKCTQCDRQKQVLFYKTSSWRNGIGETITLTGEFHCPIHKGILHYI